MKKFLVLYRMDMAEMQKMMASTSAEERKKSMEEWQVWMKRNMTSFADHGGPVGKTKQVAASGATDTKNDVGGYSIVQAESHEAAAALFADNPHITMPRATAEVMEISQCRKGDSVRYWPKADIPVCTAHVHFRGSHALPSAIMAKILGWMQ
jgi:hypothetical protein